MIGGILGHAPDWALVDAVWARSQGNPFFAEELTAAATTHRCPPSSESVIMTRVRGSPPDGQQLLRVVAVAGESASTTSCCAAVGVLDADALDGALAEAARRADPGRRPETAALPVPPRPAPRGRVRCRCCPGSAAGSTACSPTALADAPPLGPGAGPLRGRAGRRTGGRRVSGRSAFDASAHRRPTPPSPCGRSPRRSPTSTGRCRPLDRMPAESAPGPADRLRLLELASDVAYFAGAGQRSVDLVRQAIDAPARASRSDDPGAATTSCSAATRWAIGDSDAAFDAYRRRGGRSCRPTRRRSSSPGCIAEEARGLHAHVPLRDAERRCHEGLAVGRRRVGARRERGTRPLHPGRAAVACSASTTRASTSSARRRRSPRSSSTRTSSTARTPT